MLISELLESETASPAGVVTTARFDKEARRLLDADLRNKLAKWLERKTLTPTQLMGIDDRQGKYGLKPWNHLHLRYGNTILVHYLGLPKLIILAAVTDHRAVEGGSAELEQLKNYLKNLDVL